MHLHRTVRMCDPCLTIHIWRHMSDMLAPSDMHSWCPILACLSIKKRFNQESNPRPSDYLSCSLPLSYGSFLGRYSKSYSYIGLYRHKSSKWAPQMHAWHATPCQFDPCQYVRSMSVRTLKNFPSSTSRFVGSNAGTDSGHSADTALCGSKQGTDSRHSADTTLCDSKQGTDNTVPQNAVTKRDLMIPLSYRYRKICCALCLRDVISGRAGRGCIARAQHLF